MRRSFLCLALMALLTACAVTSAAALPAAERDAVRALVSASSSNVAADQPVLPVDLCSNGCGEGTGGASCVGTLSLASPLRTNECWNAGRIVVSVTHEPMAAMMLTQITSGQQQGQWVSTHGSTGRESVCLL